LGPIIDAIFGISLLFLLPDQANISVIIAITFIVACLNDLKFFQLISLNILYIASALIAGWYFDTLHHATLYSAHIVSATMILVGYVYYFKNHQLNNHSDLKDSLNTAVLQKKHLIDALFYLLPFHQRNQTPLTLLLIRIETGQIKDKSYMKEIISLYKSRLRKCDFLVQIDPQHLAILLSDTNNEQATTVVKALKQLVNKSELKNSMLNYAIAKFPLEKEIALDHILQQSMHALHEAELQKIERIIFISAKQQD
jgi:GGDEF domain-containing protein